MKLRIRSYIQEDLEHLQSIHWEDGFIKEDILDNLEMFANYGIVAEVGQDIVGIGLFTGRGDKVSMTFYVVPTYRNQGIGSKLLEHLEERMKKEGIKQAILDFEYNEGIVLWMQKKGYEPWFKSHLMLYEGYKVEHPKCRIESYKDVDYEKCQQISSTAFHEMRFKVGLQSELGLPSEEERKHYEKNQDNIFVLREEDTIVGYYNVVENELDGVAVDVNKQGRGYGKLLTSHAINTLLDRGNRQVKLWCVEGNSARYLYENLGFKTSRIHQFMYHNLI